MKNGKKHKAYVVKVGPCVVDHRTGLEEIVHQSGFEWINPHVNSKNFPPHGEKRGIKEIEVSLVRFGRNLQTYEALQRIRDLGFRPLGIRELCSFHRTHPRTCTKFFVVGLGTSFKIGRNGRVFPCIVRSNTRPHLNLFWSVDGWEKDSFFAVTAIQQKS